MLGGLLRRFFGRSWLERATAAQQASRYAEAAALCQSRLDEAPNDPDALQALAAALLAQGHAGEGLQALRKASALAPRDAQLLTTLARVCAATGDLDGAISSYGAVLALEPGSGDVADELTALLKALERYDEAEDRCRAAIAGSSDSAARRHALAGVLFEQGRVDESIAELRTSLALAADAPAVHSDLLRAMNYHDGFDPQTVYEAHAEWGRRYAEPLSLSAPAHDNDRDPARRLRVGYVSPYFRKHAVTFFFESVVEHHDRSSFDLVLYADVPHPDDYSERLRSYGAQWRRTVGMSDSALAQTVRDDAIDILVDLSGHTPGNRLLAFARKAAPVQVTWNGYPNTTGMLEMNYRVTDARCDPPGATERFHTEQLVRLPEIYMSWQAPGGTPAPGPLPASSAGGVTFASFNACYKVTPAIVRLWSGILRELPGSRLVLFTIPRGRADERIRRLFAAEGIADYRIETRRRVSHEAFLEAHQEIDIALDSFPYHGTTTTCFSLWMGVPVVSLVGPTHVSRVGLTLLSSVGLAGLAAADGNRYVAAAVTLARNIPELTALRAGLRERMLQSPLMNGAACAKALEDAYRAMWQGWCARYHFSGRA